MQTSTFQTKSKRHITPFLKPYRLFLLVFASLFLFQTNHLSAQKGEKSYTDKLCNWGGVPSRFAQDIKGAAYIGATNSVLFFSSREKLNYKLSNESSYRRTPPQIARMNQANHDDEKVIHAMTVIPNTTHLEAFYNNELVTIDLSGIEEEKEQLISFIPDHWNGRFDAVCSWNENATFFFRGPEFISYIKDSEELTPPLNYTAWKGWPSSWQKVDAVVSTGRYIYFFNRGQFIPYDNQTGLFLAGYPQKMGFSPPSVAQNTQQERRRNEAQKVVQPKKPNFSQADMRNMVETVHLGTGFDAVHVDPQDLTKNSVQNNGFSRPQVFKFIPNSHAFIRLSSLGSSSQSQNKNLPQGVRGDNHAKFEWSDETRWARTASEFQNSFSEAYRGSVGVPGIASVSGSASFEDVKTTTRSSENIYVYQDGSFRGHSLSMDLNQNHQLSDQFIQAVRNLGSSASAYDNFIQNWGTHFSSQAMMGAKCSYRFKLSKSSFEQRSESKREFEINVSATIKKVQADFGTTQGRGSARSIGSEIGASETKFISYGGSGDTNFSQWSQHATNNRTLIDVKLDSYLTLFTSKYFPNDSQIRQKKQLLSQALQRYFSRHGYRESVNPSKFYQLQEREFRITATVLEVKYAPTNEGYYSGDLFLEAFDGSFDRIKRKKVLEIPLTEYKIMRTGEQIDLSKSMTVRVPPRELKESFVTIAGELNEVTHDRENRIVAPKSMGNKTGRNVKRSEQIRLAELKKGKTVRSESTFDYSEGDQIVVRFEVKRIR